MVTDIKKENETFKQDYEKLYAKGQWNKDELDMMKNLKKLIYYNLAICAMEEGQGHPGEGHLPEMSYRGRDSMGRFTSGDGYDDGMKSWGHPYHDYRDNMSGNRYYDSEESRAMQTLHHMMNNTDDPERRRALQLAIDGLRMK